MADNYFASVGAIVLKDNQVLLVKHTYGSAKDKLLNPGGFINEGEMPFDAVKREVFEETSVIVNPIGMLSIRCDVKGWYMVILSDYVSGEPKSDNRENSEAVFMNCNDVLNLSNATDTVKTHIKLALEKKPLMPLDTGKGRILFPANNNL